MWSLHNHMVGQVSDCTEAEISVVPMECHVGYAMVVNECPGDDETMKKLMRMEHNVHFAWEESLRNSAKVNNKAYSSN